MKFENLSITTKFILWFLVIALVPLSIAIYISYNRSQAALEREVNNSLIAVADKKVNQIQTYLDKKVEDITNLSHTSDVIVAVEKYDKAFDVGIDSPEYVKVDDEYRPFLTYYQKRYGYEDLFLIRPFGDVIFSIKNQVPESVYLTGEGMYSQLANVFVQAAKSTKTEVSDFEYYSETNKGFVFIAAPIFKAGEVVGIIAVQMGTDEIAGLVRDYTGLGRTGEAIILVKIGDEAVYITPLRFDAQAAFKLKVAIGSNAHKELQQAVQGKEGNGVFPDYRNVSALTVWRHISSFRWGIIVKMDISEIFSSARRLRNTLLTVSLVLVFIVIIMAVVIASSISSPIRGLTKISSTISSGDFSARAQVKTADEIGELADSFNQMTDKLVKAKADVEEKNEELQEQKKLLEQVNQELDGFVYTASHDLRAPLRGISSFTSFLEEDYKDKLDEEGKDYLKEIREGTNRMNQLIEDLLMLSRISRIKNPFEDVKINELIDTVIKRIEFDIKEKNVDLVVKPNMPVVRCDRIKMNEVVLNLINNAIKFSAKNNKERPRVEVGYMDDGEFHKFYVRDNGIGIDPKYHEQIFGMFKRLHTAEEYEGTGAGLGIVKRVIDDHNGRVWVESELGRGAAFFFTIPKEIKKKKKIGEILVEEGVISREELDEKLKKQSAQQVGLPEFKGDLGAQ